MPGPLTPLGAQWAYDRPGARERILEALRAAQGNAVHAARALGVSHRQLCRRLMDLEIAKELARIRSDAAKLAHLDTDVIALETRNHSDRASSYDTHVVVPPKRPRKRTKPRVA